MKRFAIALTFVSVFFLSSNAVASLPPASPGTAAFSYNPGTGEICVSVNSVVNWYVEHVGYSSMTGDAPSGLPLAPGLVTDNDTRIGESAFAPFSYDVNLGNVAAAGLFDDGDLLIFWNASLGGELHSETSFYLSEENCPEPSTIALAGMGLFGLMAGRRRRAR